MALLLAIALLHLRHVFGEDGLGGVAVRFCAFPGRNHLAGRAPSVASTAARKRKARLKAVARPPEPVKGYIRSSTLGDA